jgi:hypothetical protein
MRFAPGAIPQDTESPPSPFERSNAPVPPNGPAPRESRRDEQRPERPENPERPKRPERPERPEIEASPEHPGHAGHPNVVVIGPDVAPAPIPFPGGTIQHGGFPDHVIPAGAVDIALGFFAMCAVMVVGRPLASAFGRRIERGGGTAAVPAGAADQLERIEQAVETMAIEVERIGESQRHLVQLQHASPDERSSLSSGSHRA